MRPGGCRLSNFASKQTSPESASGLDRYDGSTTRHARPSNMMMVTRVPLGSTLLAWVRSSGLKASAARRSGETQRNATAAKIDAGTGGRVDVEKQRGRPMSLRLGVFASPRTVFFA